ncbi:MAG TPA: NTF2 fold immunity protein [Candidatus Acidoferrales bacterium]
MPPEGFVPNSETAVRIAEAMLIARYGERRVESAKPFSSHLKDGIWHVEEPLNLPPGPGNGITIEVYKEWLEVQVSKLDAHIISVTVGLTNPVPGENPIEGFVPDSRTAVKIGEAVLVPVYGKAQIESELPITAKLKRDTWMVSGTLNCPDSAGRKSDSCDGGVAYVQISKADGRIIAMSHGK